MGVVDYWSTPYEFSKKGKGDCEDFAISKYYTLKYLGVDVSKIHLTYGWVYNFKAAHMILTYLTENGGRLVLDNMIPDIKLLVDRHDFTPTFSFNDNTIWLITKHFNDYTYKKIGTSNILSKWNSLESRNNLCDIMVN